MWHNAAIKCPKKSYITNLLKSLHLECTYDALKCSSQVLEQSSCLLYESCSNVPKLINSWKASPKNREMENYVFVINKFTEYTRTKRDQKVNNLKCTESMRCTVSHHSSKQFIYSSVRQKKDNYTHFIVSDPHKSMMGNKQISKLKQALWSGSLWSAYACTGDQICCPSGSPYACW